MTPRDLPPLEEDLQALLRQAPSPKPPVGMQDAVLGRLRSTLSLPTPGLERIAEAVAPASAPGPLLVTKMGTWGLPVSLAALVLGSVVGAIAGSRMVSPIPPIPLEASPVAQTQANEPSRETESKEGQPRGTPPPAPARPPLPLSVPRRPTTEAQATPAAEIPASAGGRDVQLSAERGLIEMARTSLQRQELQRAKDVLDEHERRFPSGQLVEERLSLRVQLGVVEGRAEDARRHAQEFRVRFPDSMLLPAVEAAIRRLSTQE